MDSPLRFTFGPISHPLTTASWGGMAVGRPMRFLPLVLVVMAPVQFDPDTLTPMSVAPVRLAPWRLTVARLRGGEASSR